MDVTLSHCRYIYNKMLERNTVIYKNRAGTKQGEEKRDGHNNHGSQPEI